VAIQANKPNNRVFLLLGILLAALAFGGVLFALRQNGGNTSTVVVAKKSIPVGTTLTSDLVGTIAVPSAAVPSDAYTVTTAVVGKTATVTIGANDPIVPAFFAAQPLAAATSAGGTPVVSVETQIAKGYVALAIPASPAAPPLSSSGPQMNTFGLAGEQASVGYYIQQGDHIDILIDPGHSAIRFSFQDVPVLRVGTPGGSATPSIYVVEVPRSQAELLTELVTLRGLVKDGSGTVTAGPYVVKYVLRPQSEWGKIAPDGSSFTPNYETTTGPAVPAPADPGVSLGQLDSLFGH